LTTDGLEVEARDGRLRIIREGRVKKFVPEVEQVSFSGRVAREAGRRVIIVTERAVFRLGPEGVELIEVAPGIDLHRDVLEQMRFRPIVREVKPMRIAWEGRG
jgi:propionate CoA-transferase